MRTMKCILVTGGCGFIGSNFIRHLFSKAEFDGKVINLDKLTYAGHTASVADIDAQWGDSRYTFVQGDITDPLLVAELLQSHEIDTVVHFAAESHVDRSISGPAPFIQTNLVGTFNLLECARTYWSEKGMGEEKRFHHVSTDEVFGSLSDGDPAFSETTPYDPRSPYSASKAGSDHLVRSYFHTYGLPVTVSNCSNNYGPWQYPEKLIPVAIQKAVSGQSIPVYGDGSNIRDWLFVGDHCEGIYRVLTGGTVGDTFNFGGDCELANIELVHMICDILDEIKPKRDGQSYRQQITFVTDRPGHDWRYAIDFTHAREKLGWQPVTSLESGLQKTIQWYLDNRTWVEVVLKKASG